MLTTAILAVLLISTIISTVVSVKTKTTQKETEYGDQINPRRISWVITSVLFVITFLGTFLSTFTIVKATEVAVPVSFGQVSDPLRSGVHFVAPWVSVETYPTRPVTIELSGNDKILARTADAGQMTVEIAARWRVEASKAKQLYLQVRTGDDDRISQDIVIKNLRQAVGQVYSVTGNLDALNDRVKTTEAIKLQLDQQLVKYGITIEDINLRSVEPDEKTAATISQYASQQQATRIAEEAKKTATIEAERRVIEAQGLKRSAAAAGGMTASEMQSVCMQVWQQVVTKGIEKGVTVYTTPCGNSATTVIAK
jgi:regulator of protease activity HflC (stomatin/prohibitin superfamily)